MLETSLSTWLHRLSLQRQLHHYRVALRTTYNRHLINLLKKALNIKLINKRKVQRTQLITPSTLRCLDRTLRQHPIPTITIIITKIIHKIMPISNYPYNSKSLLHLTITTSIKGTSSKCSLPSTSAPNNSQCQPQVARRAQRKLWSMQAKRMRSRLQRVQRTRRGTRDSQKNNRDQLLINIVIRVLGKVRAGKTGLELRYRSR